MHKAGVILETSQITPAFVAVPGSQVNYFFAGEAAG